MNAMEYQNLKSKYGTINETYGAVKTKQDIVDEVIGYIVQMMDSLILLPWLPSGVLAQVKKNLVKLDKSTLSLLLVLMGMLKIGIEDKEKDIQDSKWWNKEDYLDERDAMERIKE